MLEIPLMTPLPRSDATPRVRNPVLLGATALAAALSFAAGALLLAGQTPGFTIESSAQASIPSLAEADRDVAAAAPVDDGEMRAVTATAERPSVDSEAVEALRKAMLGAETPSPSAQFAAVPDAAPPVEEIPTESSETPAVADVAQLPRAVPLPVPRPPQFQGRTASDEMRRVRVPRRERIAAAPPAQTEDTRSFFEKFFGVQPSQPSQPSQTPALAYAALEAPATKPALPAAPLSPAPILPPVSAGVAVYDISARTVTLPNGERLEAHSGLGEIMDDPRYVHTPMRGATPPGTYDLTEREAPFHGVRALRMTPVGGSAAIYGRAGLLAHTYMLRGQPGASNGCVVFRNYDRFLQAYLSGAIGRLVVVPGSGGAPPAIANGATGRSARLGSDG